MLLYYVNYSTLHTKFPTPVYFFWPMLAAALVISVYPEKGQELWN